MIICGAGDCRSGMDVELTYLGVSGFMIRSGDHVVLTAPHFTNPPVDLLGLNLFGAATVDPDPALIRQFFPADGEKASAIIVGHGHYDHLLDIPFIAESLATGATIYGSPTVRNMLLGDSALKHRIVAISGDSVGTVADSGAWMTTSDGAFRFMALRSSHAPIGKLLWHDIYWARGTVDTPLARLPKKAPDWRLGDPYAYLIDVLDRDGKPVFRIYYEDAAGDAPLGLPPAKLGGRRVDVAILCMPDAQLAKPPAPGPLVEALKPRYVIASHWESFFVPRTKGIELNPASDVKRFDKVMRQTLPSDADWSMPNPGSVYRFRSLP
jgi:L-ascorbate metabolism protein UlaG (beta-lactamase superfamily)